MSTPTPAATVLDADAVAAIRGEPLGAGRATRRVLWQSGGAESGVLVVPGGSQLGEHRHRVNHHHMWVLEGTASVLGRMVGTGSYVHVPGAVDHDIDARTTDGCTVFYVYEPSAG